MDIEKLIEEREDIYKQLYDSIEYATQKVDALDKSSLIDSYKVEVKHFCFTHRGSDNYLVYGNNFRSSCNYWEYHDSYIPIPQIDIPLSKGNDRYADDEEEIISKEYPDREKWGENAKELEEQGKIQLKAFFETQYNRKAHIIHIAASKFYSSYLTYRAQNHWNRLFVDYGKNEVIEIAMGVIQARSGILKDLLFQDLVLNHLEHIEDDYLTKVEKQKQIADMWKLQQTGSLDKKDDSYWDDFEKAEEEKTNDDNY